ncbi:MAG: zinc ribbon domain-containing protein [Anaerolineales bacterium]|nr:zinc ribbon domain-containing protein [Anaerolineales bacterium]
MLDLFGITSLGKFFTYLTAFFGAFLAALWLSLIFWTLRDIRSRSHDKLVHILTALLVAVLNLPGLIIYLILRPSLTLTEEYQLTLEEEALLSQVEERLQCPGCGSDTKNNWQVCAQCHTRLRKVCRQCGELLQLPWQICPHCTTPVPETISEAPHTDLPPISK